MLRAKLYVIKIQILTHPSNRKTVTTEGRPTQENHHKNQPSQKNEDDHL